MPETPASPVRILILGGGFGGVYTARGLQDIWRDDPAVQVTLVNRNNFFLMTPLLFEAGSGILEPRHAVNAIRPLFETVRFMEADVSEIDLDRRVVTVNLPRGQSEALGYDHLVLALGGIPNTHLIAGSEHALTFKTLADAIFLRNHIIQLFEAADVEEDPARKAALLTFVLVGGGLVNVELCGELTSFLDTLQKRYPRINYEEMRIEIIEGEDSIAREFDEDLREYITEILTGRGVHIRLNMRVKKIEPGCIHLPDGTSIATETIVLGTGVVPSPIVAALPLDKDKKGRAIADATLQCKNRKELWALGDCAQVPDPTGKPYPELAQHALRQARLLASNITASIRGLPLEPFTYKQKGTLAALGHFKGAAKMGSFKIRGFLAWWIWRTYYLMQMFGFSRKVRIILDWTLGLLFKNDIVQLDLYGESHPSSNRPAPEATSSVAPAHE
jgi:NADH dehydrogenase